MMEKAERQHIANMNGFSGAFVDAAFYISISIISYRMKEKICIKYLEKGDKSSFKTFQNLLTKWGLTYKVLS